MGCSTIGSALSAGWRRGGVCVVLAILFTSGCTGLRYRGPIESQVVDAQTGQPLAGAVAVAVWTRREGLPGLYSTKLVAVQEAVTDTAGRFTLTRPAGSISEERVTVYKFGYIAWNNAMTYPTSPLHENARVPARIALKSFPADHSRRWHLDSFIAGAMGWTISEQYAPRFWQASRPERELATREPIKRSIYPPGTPDPTPSEPPSIRFQGQTLVISWHPVQGTVEYQLEGRVGEGPWAVRATTRIGRHGGAGRGGRTPTGRSPREFESRASAGSASPARLTLLRPLRAKPAGH